MGFRLTINGTSGRAGRYVSWAPSACLLRTTGMDHLATRTVRISNRAKPGGGRLVFYESLEAPPRATLTLKLTPLAGAVRFWVGGRFASASKEDGDTEIVVSRSPGGAELLAVPCMVRVRKNANTLTAGERDRFLRAMAAVNNQGNGVFQLFRDMHVDAATDEAHGDMGFLPWHRTYLLDLERELQQVDPSVALPYWRFDEPAQHLFDRAFIGVANPQGAVEFSSTNPLRFWVTDGAPGINRAAEFDTANESARSTSPPPTRVALSEASTLAIGAGTGHRYREFAGLEGNPHGTAHVSFGGMISQIGTAAKDPLFFLLHANVDRLWAKWQWLFKRFDRSEAAAFSAGSRIGHRLNDSMWPWNGITGGIRPPTAPGGGLMTSAVAQAPGGSPIVGQMLDYQGHFDPTARLGFDYDDVPYA